MKKIFQIIKIMLLILIAVNISNGQIINEYKWLNPKPQGNDLFWVKMWDASNTYMIGDRGVFLNTHFSGNTFSWEEIYSLYANSGGLTPHRKAHFFSKLAGIIVGNDGRILRTTNLGLNWSVSTLAQDTSANWQDIYFLDSNTGFICGSKDWVGKTTNGGVSWTGIAQSTLNPKRCVVAKDASNILAGYINGVVIRTTNGGANWSSVITGLGSINLDDIAVVGGDTVYVVGKNKVGMSTDFGATWSNLSGSLNSGEFLSDIDFVNITGTKYACLTGRYGVYRAPVGSSAWDSLITIQSMGLPYEYSGQLRSSDFTVTGDTFTTVGDLGFIYKNYGSHDTVLTNYIKSPGYYLYDIWAESTAGKVLVCGEQTYVNPLGDHNQIMYSTNGGQDWQTSGFTSNDDEVVSISMINSLTGYAGSYYNNVYKTTNGGLSWDSTQAQPTVLRGSSVSEIFFTDANTGYVFGDENSKTTNGGASWTVYASGQSFNYIRGTHFVNSNTGWTVGDGDEVFKTINGGANVNQQNSGAGTTLNDVFMFDANTGWIVGENGKVRKTTNGGTNWDTADVPYQTSLYKVYFIDQFNGITVGDNGLAYRTRDGGNTWEVGNTSSSSNSSVWMTATNRAFVTGFEGGIFQYKETVTGDPGLTFTNEVPSGYHLEQNYPNPFNPTTTIKFGLPGKGLVSLKVYDIAGREVAGLINNQNMNAGEVKQTFDGSDLSSGVYFYSLIVDGQLIATKKMVLVK